MTLYAADSGEVAQTDCRGGEVMAEVDAFGQLVPHIARALDSYVQEESALILAKAKEDLEAAYRKYAAQTALSMFSEYDVRRLSDHLIISVRIPSE